MRQPYLRSLSLMACAFVAGCGVRVPPLHDGPPSSTESQLLVQAIAESVKCDIAGAVRYVIDEDKNLPHRNAPWFDDWGVQYSLTFTVEEKTSVSPNILWRVPSPATSVFTLGAGANASATATRTSKMNFFYMIDELYNAPPCGASTKTKYRLQSLLIRDDLKLRDWLTSYMLVVGTGAGGAPNTPGTPIKTEAITDRIKFQVVTGASVSPAWQMARLDVNRSGSIIGLSRDRTHDLLLTYGPADPKTRRLVGPASDAFIAAQIGAAVIPAGL